MFYVSFGLPLACRHADVFRFVLFWVKSGVGLGDYRFGFLYVLFNHAVERFYLFGVRCGEIVLLANVFGEIVESVIVGSVFALVEQANQLPVARVH